MNRNPPKSTSAGFVPGPSDDLGSRLSPMIPTELTACQFPTHNVPVEGSNIVVGEKGGQAMAWAVLAPSGELHQIFFVAPNTDLSGRSPVRAGAQLAGFPMFGDGKLGNFNRSQFDPERKLPAHSFARSLFYQVEDGREAQQCEGRRSNSIKMRSSSSEATLSAWPHAFDITSEVINSCGEGSYCQTGIVTFTNRSSSVLPCQGFFHTYFRVGNAADTFIRGVAGRDYIDAVDNDSKKVESTPGERIFDGTTTVCKVYPGLSTATIVDPVLNRNIKIVGGTTDRPAQEGEYSLIAWNPGDAPPAGLTAEDSKKFICLECGILQARLLVPGESMQVAWHCIVDFEML